MKLFKLLCLASLLWLTGCASGLVDNAHEPRGVLDMSVPGGAGIRAPQSRAQPGMQANTDLLPISAEHAASGVVVPLLPPADLWERIRRGYAMPDLDNPLVHDREQWYSHRPDYILRMTERSRKYIFHIVEELERRNMPTELALLPFIAIPPTLVKIVVPFCVRFSTLPVPAPNFRDKPVKFHATLSCTVTVLLEEPTPIAKPPNMVALVTNIELLPPPVEPMVIRPLLDKVLAPALPMTFKLLLLPPNPTVIAPEPKYAPPLVIVTKLLFAPVTLPMTSAPLLVQAEPGSVTVTELLFALVALPMFAPALIAKPPALTVSWLLDAPV